MQEIRPSATAGHGAAGHAGQRVARAKVAARMTVCVVIACAAGGCTPEYNWRELRPADAHWVAMLPAKPATATRDIRLGELPVKMTMHGAKVHDTAFTVAEAPLPAAGDPAAAVAAMREALVRNIGGKETAAAPVPIPVEATAGGPARTAAGVALEAAGSIRGKPARLQARIVAHDGRAYQALVVGTDLDPEQAKTFLESFRLHD